MSKLTMSNETEDYDFQKMLHCRAGLSPRGPHAKFLREALFSLSHLIPFPHPFAEVLFISYKINNTVFSVLNLRSTTYSKKLIAALHTLTAFCICKCVNNITKLNKEGKGWRKMDQGIAVFR